MIYDFLVICGGVTGTSGAYELAAHDSVLLLEAENTAGYHATGRSAAVFPRIYGGPVVRQLNAASTGFFRSPPVGFYDAPLLAVRGCLAVASAGHEGEIDALMAMAEPGEMVCRIDPREALEMVPFLRPDRIDAAVFDANVSDIDVATLHLSYIKGTRARGAVIMTKLGVSVLSSRADVWPIDTGNYSFSAAPIINAAGTWADMIGSMAGARTIGLAAKRRTGISINAPSDKLCANLPVIDLQGRARI